MAIIAADTRAGAALAEALRARGAIPTLCATCDEALDVALRVPARALIIDPDLEEGAALTALRAAARAMGGPAPVGLGDAGARRRALDAGAVVALDPYAPDLDALAHALADAGAPFDEGRGADARADDRFGAHIDRAIYDELAAAMGPDMMGQLLERMALDIGEQRDLIAAALDGPDLAAMRRATHVLISVAGSLGAVPLQRQAEDLNALANAGDGSAARDAAGRLLTEAGEVLLFVGER